MDILKKKASQRCRGFAGILLLLCMGSLPSYGYEPTVLLGVYGQELFSSDQGTQTGIRSSALLSWRTLVADKTSLGFYARSMVDLNFLGDAWCCDSHILALEAMVRAEGGRLLLEGGFSGSGNGTIEGQVPYLRPDWRIGFERFGADALCTIAYSGYYLHQPSDSDDALFQGLTAGVVMDPSIRLRYGMEILGGWENWTEQDRSDLLGSLKASVGGLIGYFVDWGIGAQGGLRWSDQSAESNLYFNLDSEWAWSPRRQVSLELSAFAREELYLWSQTAADVSELSTGADFRADWTPNDRLYLVTELSADEVDEIFTMRIALETKALERAIPNLSSADFIRAKSVLEIFENEQDRSQWSALNWEFHATLYQASQMPRLLHTIETLHNNVTRYLIIYLDRLSAQDISQKEHSAIFNACQKRNIDAATRQLTAHLRKASKRLMAFLS